MIDLYTWQTSNGRKTTIMLEELGIPYNLHPININKDVQFTPEYLALNPNAKIPTIVDQDGPGGGPYSVIESGAILIYLADKTGRFLPAEGRPRYEVLQWLMFQMGGVGPMFGQAHYFRRQAKEKVPFAIERYTTETRRLWSVLDGRLDGCEFIAGDYSIADIAIFPWTARYEWQGIALEEYPNVKKWFEALYARPAVKKGMAIPPLP